MSAAVPHRSNVLTSSLNPTRSSQSLRTTGSYPGRPELSGLFPPSGALTTTNEFKANASINITVNTASPDKNVNIHQYAFTCLQDFRELSKNPNAGNLGFNDPNGNRAAFMPAPNGGSRRWRLVNLQNLNKILASDSMMDASKDQILTIFQPFGVVATGDQNDSDTFGSRGTFSGRSMLSQTVTVAGAATVYDYWSYKSNLIRPRSNLFFVLKKVQLTDKTTYQDSVAKANRPQSGYKAFPTNRLNREILRWQVLPVFSEKCSLNSSDLITSYTITSVTGAVQKKTEIGHAWHVGSVHWSPDIMDGTTAAGRNEYSTSQDLYKLTMGNRTAPVQVFLECDRCSGAFL